VEMIKKRIGLTEGKDILGSLKDTDLEIYYRCLGKLLPRHRAIVNLFLEGKTSCQIGVVWKISGNRAIQIFGQAVTRVQTLFLGEKHLAERVMINDIKITAEKALDLPIESLDVCVRTLNCLKVMTGGVPAQLRDVVVRTEVELLELNYFGKKSLEELKFVLQELGLFLGMRI